MEMMKASVMWYTRVRLRKRERWFVFSILSATKCSRLKSFSFPQLYTWRQTLIGPSGNGTYSVYSAIQEHATAGHDQEPYRSTVRERVLRWMSRTDPTEGFHAGDRWKEADPKLKIRWAGLVWIYPNLSRHGRKFLRPGFLAISPWLIVNKGTIFNWASVLILLNFSQIRLKIFFLLDSQFHRIFLNKPPPIDPQPPFCVWGVRSRNLPTSPYFFYDEPVTWK